MMYMMLHVDPFLAFLLHISHIEDISQGCIPQNVMSLIHLEKPYSIKGLGRLRMTKRQK